MHDYGSDVGVLRRLAKIGNNPAGTVRCWQLPKVPQSELDIADFCETLERLLSKSLIQFIELPLGDDVELHPRLLAGIGASGAGVKLLWSGSDPELLSRALAYLHPFVLFSEKPLTAEEIAALHGFQGVVVFAPGRALGNAGLTGVRAAIDAGLAVALSSGYDAVSYPAYSMQMAVSLASVYGQLSLEEAISASTVNAAHAIGCGATRGSLMKGRRADILVLNLPDYREIPRQFGINHVRMAIRDGNVIINRGGWKMGTHETTLPDRVRAQRVGGA
jgi:imidazolonepropionase